MARMRTFSVLAVSARTERSADESSSIHLA